MTSPQTTSSHTTAMNCRLWPKLFVPMLVALLMWAATKEPL